MNLSGSGASWSIGPKGASLGIGKRGTFLNTGIPGTGLSHRQMLSGSKNSASTRGTAGTPAMAKVALTVAVDDDGVVSFRTADGGPASEALVDAAKAQKSDLIKGLIQQACDKINAQMETVTGLHLDTPDPRTPPHFRHQVFGISEPTQPCRRQLGFFAKLFKSNQQRVEKEYQASLALYQVDRKEWESTRDEFERSEEERRQLFMKVQAGDAGATEDFFGHILLDIGWPRETQVSFEVENEGSLLLLNVDLPEIEDMPQKTATAPQRGYRLSIKQLGPVQTQKLYAQHIHSIGFRLLGEAFGMLPKVSEVILSGYSQRPDPGTGQLRDEYLLSVRVTRTEWEKIDFGHLSDIDVGEALSRFHLVRSMSKSGLFKAIVPITLTPVS